MTRDVIVFYDRKEALDFYLKSLLNGIYVDWEIESINRRYKVIVDKEKTLNNKGGKSMGFNFRWSDNPPGIVELNGFNLDHNMKARVNLKKLIRLVKELREQEHQGEEIKQPEEVLDSIMNEIVELPDENGEYYSEFY